MSQPTIGQKVEFRPDRLSSIPKGCTAVVDHVHEDGTVDVRVQLPNGKEMRLCGLEYMPAGQTVPPDFNYVRALEA